MTKFSELLQNMGQHSLHEFPKEACGIITKSLEYIPCKNISKNPKTSFVVDPVAILANDGNILGFFHSHPGSSDPIPSSRDASSALFDEFVFVVGFGTNFYKYWLDNSSLKFERFNEDHLKVC